VGNNVEEREAVHDERECGALEASEGREAEIGDDDALFWGRVEGPMRCVGYVGEERVGFATAAEGEQEVAV
jgi:hypothetical protein